ncbi:MAG: hypothetical protein WDN24_01360 [Sphingomonas sp.]
MARRAPSAWKRTRLLLARPDVSAALASGAMLLLASSLMTGAYPGSTEAGRDAEFTVVVPRADRQQVHDWASFFICYHLTDNDSVMAATLSRAFRDKGDSSFDPDAILVVFPPGTTPRCCAKPRSCE